MKLNSFEVMKGVFIMGEVMTKTDVRFDWRPMLVGGFECEVDYDGRLFALAVEPLQASPWEQAVWMIHTPVLGTHSGARRLAADLALTIDEGKAAAEAAALRLFAGTIERVQ